MADAIIIMIKDQSRSQAYLTHRDRAWHSQGQNRWVINNDISQCTQPKQIKH